MSTSRVMGIRIDKNDSWIVIFQVQSVPEECVVLEVMGDGKVSATREAGSVEVLAGQYNGGLFAEVVMDQIKELVRESIKEQDILCVRWDWDGEDSDIDAIALRLFEKTAIPAMHILAEYLIGNMYVMAGWYDGAFHQSAVVQCERVKAVVERVTKRPIVVSSRKTEE